MIAEDRQRLVDLGRLNSAVRQTDPQIADLVAARTVDLLGPHLDAELADRMRDLANLLTELGDAFRARASALEYVDGTVESGRHCLR